MVSFALKALLALPLVAGFNYPTEIAELADPNHRQLNGCHSCDCFTCDSVVDNGDGFLTVTVGHCKGGSISWMCCVGADGGEGNCPLASCSGSQAGSKCQGVTPQAGLVVTVPATTGFITINTHDGKTAGNAGMNNNVCGGNGNQGGGCAKNGYTAHCLLDFDLEDDCGYKPPAGGGGTPAIASPDSPDAPAPATPDAPAPEPASSPEESAGGKPEKEAKSGGGGGPKASGAGGSAVSVDETCPVEMQLGPGNGGDFRCCAGKYNEGAGYGECETSSCVENFDAKNLNCFNYGSPQHPNDGKKELSDTKKGGSQNCPYVETDRAVCDTSYFTELNGENCRDNQAANHCLGKVKCQSGGVDVPKNGNSDGTATGGGDCSSLMFPEGTLCFYNGNSENWKVCGPDEPASPEEVPAPSPDDVPAPSPEEAGGGAGPPANPSPDAPSPDSPDSPSPEAPDSPSPEDRTTPKAFTKGDPHFKTFGGELYDYHGECDLVLLHNPEFHNGLGMDIHIRTKIEAFWSSVESAVLRVGKDTMEIKADPSAKEWIWFNKQLPAQETAQGEWAETKVGGFLVRYKDNGSNTREAVFYIQGSKEVVVLKTFKSFVRVDINWEGSLSYEGAVGLLGSKAHNGERLGRDGQFVKNHNAFGQEWQVRPDIDGALFHSYEGAVVGKKCVMPPKYNRENAAASLRGRRLGAAAIDTSAAEKACNHLVDPEEIKACVFDVLATQDLNMASTW